MKEKLITSAFALAVIILIGISGNIDYERKQIELEHYCKMVEIYQKTDGKHGWPDYDNKGEYCDETYN